MRWGGGWLIRRGDLNKGNMVRLNLKVNQSFYAADLYRLCLFFVDVHALLTRISEI